MEIYFWEDLDKVRYFLDGSGRKENASASLIAQGETTETKTPRCKTGKLCGYELMKDLDFCEPTHFRVSTGVACTSVSEDPRNTPGDTSDDVSVQKPVSGHPFYNEGKGWEPIGATGGDASFNTVFEGSGRTITNLYVSERDRSALFSVVSAAEFHNLDLVDVYLSSSSGGLIAVVGSTNTRIEKAYYLAPTSGALQAVGDDNSFTTTEHQRIETQLQGTSLQTELGSAFYFKADEYPFLRKLLPGGDGFFGSSDDTYSENNDLLGGQQ